MLFYTNVSNNRFVDYEFKPLFIDHYLTKPARGELGKNILDHVSNLSKDLNTTLSVNRYDNTATLIKNTHTSQKTNYKCLSQLKNGVLVSRVGYGVPVEIGGGSNDKLILDIEYWLKDTTLW